MSLDELANPDKLGGQADFDDKKPGDGTHTGAFLVAQSDVATYAAP